MKKVLLIIRDGYGHRTAVDDNAVLLAKTPFTANLHKQHPSCLLETSGRAVGLPEGYMGGSEVGHLTIGSGCVRKESLLRISDDIESGSFFRNGAFLQTIREAKQNGTAVHLMGLLQPAGVHAHQEHLFALLRMCAQEGISSERIWVHIFSDGRDTPKTNLIQYVTSLKEVLAETGGRIGTLIGRYYAMDRDTRWDRTELAYRLLVHAQGTAYTSFDEVAGQLYSLVESDEFIMPMVFAGYTGMHAGDAVLLYNYRTDRTRQLMRALLEGVEAFTDEHRPFLRVAAMTRVYPEFSGRVAYEKEVHAHTLGEVVSMHGLRQLRISETEKYPHVTYFFNARREEPYDGEERILIPSPRDVATYDKKPEMSIYEVCDALITAMREKEYSLIVVNYVNGDMVGHTGNLDAAIRAVEAVDACVEKTVLCAQEKGYDILLFADHGNCEEMAGEHQTSHTLNKVDCIYIGSEKYRLVDGGLADIAPTTLHLLNLPLPKEMTGSSLLRS